MNFASLRIQKIDQGTETAAHNHNLRASGSKTEPNVNHSRSSDNELLLGSRDTVKTLNQIIDDLDLKTAVRKDANRAIEIVLSASPEYFYDFEKASITREQWDELIPANYKDRMDVYWQKLARVQKHLKKDNFEKWKTDTVAWVQNEFGKNVVNLILHMDEKTPHMHLLVVPVVNGKLTAKQFFTPVTSTKWQDNYSKATGLRRGISSEKKHDDKLANAIKQAEKKGYRRGLKAGKAQALKEAQKPLVKLGNMAKTIKTGLFTGWNQLTPAEQDAQRALKEYDKKLEAEKLKNRREQERLHKKYEASLIQEQEQRKKAQEAFDYVLKVGGSPLKKKLDKANETPEPTRLSVQERQQVPEELAPPSILRENMPLAFKK
ncbi:MobV family relaxase [Comamonas sp. AG1104]|uniref:MobV family relaxase n=1 Tax=Comamonas sp. AG1104 TaxID=2183900 RepID=UPI000E0BC0D6|nr:MobV family relaxase [Comamonas sp. AG1104]RDI15377.1 plasmid recombination enzyme [Comamonas sp. AG1104]